MTPAEYGRKIAALAADFPPGSQVWHKANGTKGLVIGYEIRYEGNAFVIVDHGQRGPSAEYAMCLSIDRVVEGGDGEEWKESA